MKIIAINVSAPQSVTIHGKQVETGIFKQRVDGPVRVSSLNLEGDGQADLTVHGGPDKAVYFYTWESILYWRQQLHREDLGAGSFGENLTVDALSETDVAIGDEFAIGSACLVITQPRLPCYKLALALETPSIPKTFLESGRTGFYARVIREGVLQAGDPIVPLPSHELEKVTVAEFVEFYRRKRATRDEINRILRLKALPESWKDWLTGRNAIKHE